MPNGNTLNNSAFDSLSGNLLGRPMAHGKSILLRVLTSQRDNLGYLFGSECWWATATVAIRDGLQHQGLQFLIRGPLQFSLVQTVLRGDPSSPPTANSLWIDSKLNSHLNICPPLSAQQNNLHADTHLLRCSMRPHLRCKYLLLAH